jgi:hypothetical protein
VLQDKHSRRYGLAVLDENPVPVEVLEVAVLQLFARRAIQAGRRQEHLPAILTAADAALMPGWAREGVLREVVKWSIG